MTYEAVTPYCGGQWSMSWLSGWKKGVVIHSRFLDEMVNFIFILIAKNNPFFVTNK